MKQVIETAQSGAVGQVHGGSNQVFRVGRVERRPDGNVTLESAGQTFQLMIRPTDLDVAKAFLAVSAGDVFERAQIWGELAACSEPPQMVVGKVALGERKKPDCLPDVITPWGERIEVLHGDNGNKIRSGGVITPVDDLQLGRLRRAPQNVSFVPGPGGTLRKVYY